MRLSIFFIFKQKILVFTNKDDIAENTEKHIQVSRKSDWNFIICTLYLQVNKKNTRSSKNMFLVFLHQNLIPNYPPHVQILKFKHVKNYVTIASSFHRYHT